MSEWIERVRAAKQAGDPAPLLEHVPYAGFLGLSFELREDELIVLMPYADRLIGDSALPALHGGTIGALLESAAIFSLLWTQECEQLPKTINLTIDYLRSGRPVDTRASAMIVKRGRRVANVRATAWQDDPTRPIATAHAHFLLVR